MTNMLLKKPKLIIRNRYQIDLGFNLALCNLYFSICLGYAGHPLALNYCHYYVMSQRPFLVSFLWSSSKVLPLKMAFTSS